MTNKDLLTRFSSPASALTHKVMYIQSLVHMCKLWHSRTSARNSKTQYFNTLIITHKVLQELEVQSSKSELRVMAKLNAMCWKMWRLTRHSDEPQLSHEHKNILYTSSSIPKNKEHWRATPYKIQQKKEFLSTTKTHCGCFFPPSATAHAHKCYQHRVETNGEVPALNTYEGRLLSRNTC